MINVKEKKIESKSAKAKVKEKYLLTVSFIQILITVLLIGCFVELNLATIEDLQKRVLPFVVYDWESLWSTFRKL